MCLVAFGCTACDASCRASNHHPQQWIIVLQHWALSNLAFFFIINRVIHVNRLFWIKLYFLLLLTTDGQHRQNITHSLVQPDGQKCNQNKPVVNNADTININEIYPTFALCCFTLRICLVSFWLLVRLTSSFLHSGSLWWDFSNL